jgi:hypothetical protein
MSTMQVPDSLAATVRDQLGLVHRQQILDHGVSVDALRWALGRRWQFVLPGVVATFTGRLDAQQRLVAAALYAGPHAALASSAAARWHGCTTLPRSDQLHFLVPSRLAARRAGQVVVRRTDRPDERVRHRPPLSVCSPARAVADAARDLRSTDAAAALVVEAVQRGIVTLADLRHELEAGPRRHSRPLRESLAVAELGVWSLPEHQLHDALSASEHLPALWPNPALTAPDGSRLPTPDGWLDDVALAIQVHSVRWHAMGDDWDGTVMNDGIYAEYGVAVLALTPARIRDDPGWVRRRVERAHASLLGRRRPAVTATPRTALVRAAGRAPGPVVAAAAGWPDRRSRPGMIESVAE